MAEAGNDALDVQAMLDFARDKGRQVAETLLQAHPEANAIYAHNDEMALGAIKAIEAAKRDIIVIGFDGTDDAVEAVNDGSMLATVAQQAGMIGALGVETADKILKGEEVPEYTPVPLKLIQK